MSDPDFISRAIDDSNRFQSVADSNAESHRYQTRLLEQKKAFWNETIQLRLVHKTSNDAPTTICTWKIPRFRLTRNMLEDACNRAWIAHVKENEAPSMTELSALPSEDGDAPITPLVLSHLHDEVANTVIMPDDMQSQCNGRVTYVVIARTAGAVKGGGLLSCGGGIRRKQLEQQLVNSTDSEVQIHYDGDLCFICHDVPKTSQNSKYQVAEADIRRYIIEGATRDDHSMTLPNKRLLETQQTLEKLERELKTLIATGAPVDFVSVSIERTKEDIKQAQFAVDAARATHFNDCLLSITPLPSKMQGENKDGNASVSWKVVVKGRKREYYQQLISKNNTWSLVPLYATGDLVEDTKKKTKRQDEKKDFAMHVSKSDQVEHFVDVGGIRLEKLPDGFGVFESFTASSSISHEHAGNVEGQHMLYHGRFHEGAMHGDGTLYQNSSVYSGRFQSDERSGHGVIEYSDGITLTGDFALARGRSLQPKTNDKTSLGMNPYARGVPHGQVHIVFANGDEYQGEMWNGNITGKGVYRYAVENSRKKKEPKKFRCEKEGEWVNGTLQNADGIEGQGCSNLLRSLLFGGTRFWNP